MNRLTLTVLACLLPGCFRESDVSLDSDSDESSSGDGSSEANAASSAGSSVSTTTSATAGSASGGQEAGSDSDASSDSSLATDDGASTGEVVTDFALAFAGSSIASSAPTVWDAQDFTIEAWIEIVDEDATGILVDHQDVALSVGWTLFVHDDWGTFTIVFFDGGHAQQIVVGGSPQDLGVGWHHVAVTKSGSIVVFHMDGVALPTTPVSPSVATSQMPLSVGDRPGAYSQPLVGINIDDVRISDLARYDANFAPPVVFDDDASTAILLVFDEGYGDQTMDAQGTAYAITGPQWVAGHE